MDKEEAEKQEQKDKEDLERMSDKEKDLDREKAKLDNIVKSAVEDLEAKRREKVQKDLEEFTATKKKAKESQRKVMTIAYLSTRTDKMMAQYEGGRADAIVSGGSGQQV